RKYGLTATFYTWVVMVGRKNHMSWDQVKELSDAGMAIGCHTMTHPYLTKIPTDAEMRWQIAHAKDVIEERIGKRITTFAYPFGQYDEKVVSFVKEAGFTSARSTWPGVVHTVEGEMSLTGLIRTESAMALEQAITEEMRAADASTARGAETILGLSDQESPLP
ncbi:MAG TPA: polysaccharide deacetylase family protein, partial [Spirochaetia bacterium]